MGYDVGDTRTFEQRTFNPAGELTAPTTLELALTDPAGTTTTYTIVAGLTTDEPGAYHVDVLLDAPGVWRWTWTGEAAGGNTEVEAGALSVGAPRNAAPWIGAEDVFACAPCARVADDDRDYAEAALAALAATEMLFLLTHRRYSGIATVTVRPCRRGGWDQPGWLSASGYGYGDCGCGASSPAGCRCSRLRAVDLGPAVLDVHAVTIDGDAFTDYRLDGNRWLVRTDGDTWPSAQDLHLADTEDGTWSVELSHGIPPTTLAVLAARRLACDIYQACGGGECALPANVAALSSAGESIVFADPNDLLQAGTGKPRTGIRIVDDFLDAEWYGDATLGTVTVSPDAGPKAWQTG